MKAAIHLGYQIAAIYVPDREKKEYGSPSLTLVQPSGIDESGYSPAETVQVLGIESLRALKKLLNDHVPDEEVK